MPSIENLKIKKNKKFEKKEFRPWDTPPEKEKVAKTLPEMECLKREVVPEKKVQNLNSSQSFGNDRLRKIKRRLYGPQKDVIAYLLKIIEFKDKDKYFLSPMIYVEVSEELNITLPTLKSILNKFKKEGLIELDDYKPGRGGYGCYVINEDVHTFFKNNDN